MVARFLAPDLTQLSPAALIEEIDAEVILAAQKASSWRAGRKLGRRGRTCRRSIRSGSKPSR